MLTRLVPLRIRVQPLTVNALATFAVAAAAAAHIKAQCLLVT
jgi:hypothetical protein